MFDYYSIIAIVKMISYLLLALIVWRVMRKKGPL